MRTSKSVLLVVLVALCAAGCADILGLDPLGPAVRSADDDQDFPDAGPDASAADQ